MRGRIGEDESFKRNGTSKGRSKSSSLSVKVSSHYICKILILQYIRRRGSWTEERQRTKGHKGKANPNDAAAPTEGEFEELRDVFGEGLRPLKALGAFGMEGGGGGGAAIGSIVFIIYININ